MENSRQSKELTVLQLWSDTLSISYVAFAFQTCLLQSMAISTVIAEEGFQDHLGKGKDIQAGGNIVHLFLTIWTVEHFAMEKGEK